MDHVTDRNHPSSTNATTSPLVNVIHAWPPSDSSSTRLAFLPPAKKPRPTASPSDFHGLSRLSSQPRAVTYRANESVVPPPQAARAVVCSPARAAMAPMADFSMSRNAEFKDELAREAEASVTPGVDNTPYIQHALDALTRPREDFDHGNTAPSHLPQPPPPPPPPGPADPSAAPLLGPTRPVQNGRYGDLDAMSPEELFAALRQRRADEARREALGIAPEASAPFQPGLPYSTTPKHPADFRIPEEALPRNQPNWQAVPDVCADPEEALDSSPLVYKPRALRPVSLLILATLSLLMTAALIFCATYSSSNDGLISYSSTIYDGYYFVFRIMPQLIAAAMVIYAQHIIATVFRVFPYSAMASDDVRERRDAVFLPLYPKFLWPQLFGPWQVWIPVLIMWILNFTIPLQSSLFTVVLVDGIWTWSTVQGVAWVLVAIYLALLLSTCVSIIFWHHRRTGFPLGWDFSTIADVTSLLNQSNSLEKYEGTELAASRSEIRQMLGGKGDRLGYWSIPDAPRNGRFLAIRVATVGEDSELEAGQPSPKEAHYMRLNKPRELQGTNDGSVRYRYLPWCLGNIQITFLVALAALLLAGLFAISFNSSTDLRNGFLPGLSAAPIPGAFSAADFVWSFVPSLIGLLLWLGFQSLDIYLRILTPWGELSRPQGSPARTSILLDYAACFPLVASCKAAKHGHWRVAFTSFLSIFLVMIPVMAGGIFIALTPPDLVVRTYPNVPAYAILLALLVLLLLGLASLVPARRQFRLPHAVTCLAEIISFCANDQLRTDDAFLCHHPAGGNKSGHHLKGAAYQDEEDTWCFGTGTTGNGRLGVKRKHRFMAMRMRLQSEEADRLDRDQQQLLLGRGDSRNPIPTNPAKPRKPGRVIISPPRVEGSNSMMR